MTSLGNEKCARAERVYREGAIYAMQSLNLPNVAIYLDAGHAGWLGHAGSVGRTAALFNELYELAQRPRAVRGLATNVSNFNGFNLTSPPIYAQGSGSNWDEWRYVSALTPHLEGGGFPAHFIIDTGRSGQQPAGRTSWSQWCNLLGTGFGVRPTSDGVPAEAKRIVDAFVWVKPGGEADGTSDRNAPRYDENCGGEHAMQPAPEAGEWFQEYFEQLINLANPPL